MARKEIKQKLAIWDADFIPYYVCHNKFGTEIKSLQDCYDLADQLIYNINVTVKADIFCGYMTTGKCFRYGVNPQYKANRKHQEPMPYSYETKAYIMEKYNFNYDEKYEADDLVLSTKRCLNDKYECTIVSPDKDLLNIEGTHYNPKLNKFVTTNSQEANYAFWYDMITGQSGDNIKGIQGDGPKKAFEVLNRPNILSYRNIVFDRYCEVYGEYNGIKEFYKNYYTLKLIDDIEGIDIRLNNIEQVVSE